MKRIQAALCALLLAVIAIFSSCTQNNGHIGEIFGNWKLEKVEAEGLDSLHIDYPMYWAFQNSTFRCIYQNAQPEGEITYGNFRLTDNTLFLSFPDSIYAPPSALPIARESEWQLLRLTGSELTVTTNVSLTQTLTLSFKKW